MDWLQGLLAMCVNRDSHAPDKEKTPRIDGELLEALIPGPEQSPPPKAGEPAKETPKVNLGMKLKVADMVLAGIGLYVGCWVLGALEPSLQKAYGVTLFAPPMMASGIIFFAGPAPPSPKPFLFGTLGSATLSVGVLAILGLIGAPNIATQGCAAGVLLMWYKSTNVLFPPAIVLAGALVTTLGITSGPVGDDAGLKKFLTYLACPWLTGHFWLYIVAMVMSKVRGRARVSLAAAALSDVENSRSDDELKQIFKKFDTSGDGALDTEELKVALRVALGIDLSPADCKAMIAQYDKDGTETVDFHEFLLICRH